MYDNNKQGMYDNNKQIGANCNLRKGFLQGKNTRNLYMSYSETYLKQQSVAPEITAFLLDNWQHSRSQGNDTSYDKWYECKGYKLVHPKFN